MAFFYNVIRLLRPKLYVPRTSLDQFFLIRRKLGFHLRPKHHLTNQFRQLFKTGTYTASSTPRYTYPQSALLCRFLAHLNQTLFEFIHRQPCPNHKCDWKAMEVIVSKMHFFISNVSVTGERATKDLITTQTQPSIALAHPLTYRMRVYFSTTYGNVPTQTT